MATFRSPVGNFTFESLVAFLGALLVFPLLIKLAFGLVKGGFRVLFGILSFTTTKKLIAEAALVGLTTLLTKEDVLDKLFGRPGRRGDGLLKPETEATS